MASTTKKGSENTKAKRRRPVVKTPLAKETQTIAELRRQLAELSRELQDCKRQRSEDSRARRQTLVLLDRSKLGCVSCSTLLDGADLRDGDILE